MKGVDAHSDFRYSSTQRSKILSTTFRSAWAAVMTGAASPENRGICTGETEMCLNLYSCDNWHEERHAPKKTNSRTAVLGQEQDGDDIFDAKKLESRPGTIDVNETLQLFE